MLTWKGKEQFVLCNILFSKATCWFMYKNHMNHPNIKRYGKIFFWLTKRLNFTINMHFSLLVKLSQNSEVFTLVTLWFRALINILSMPRYRGVYQTNLINTIGCIFMILFYTWEVFLSLVDSLKVSLSVKIRFVGGYATGQTVLKSGKTIMN